MTKKDLNEILDYIELNYNDFNDSMRNEWAKKMVFYDKKLVLEALEKIMSDEFYQRKLPTLTYILRGLPKADEIESFKNRRVLCDICRRPFENVEEMGKHYQRCCCVSTIKRETKKYKGVDLTDYEVAQLYQMSDEEFEERYKKLARFLIENSDLDWQKRIMECYLNPPSPEKAKEVLERKEKKK